MFSAKTKLELTFAIQKMDKSVVERMLIFFGFSHFVKPLPLPTKAHMVNVFLEHLAVPSKQGPVTNSFQFDVLQFVIDEFYRSRKRPQYVSVYDKSPSYDDLFAIENPLLANSLKRDGFLVKGIEIRKSLPD